MKRIDALKYLGVLTLPALAYLSFHSHDWLTYLPVIETFVLIPLLEVMFRPDHHNISNEEEEIRKKDRLYDFVVYLTVPVQFWMLWVFLNTINEPGLSMITLIGRISSMGLLCGVIGINVAHELGHRHTNHEKLMAKALLLTSLYMHFFIEHNRGHHKNVSTEEDPASARYGEVVYTFWLRSIINSYLSAWKLESEKLEKRNASFISLQNEMLWFQLIQVALVLGIFFLFGLGVMFYFLAAALMGILLLETVNYIEHYGLKREKNPQGKYERVMPHHSWNSDHVIGRLVLFELSRHSDHHYIASRKYQVLRHMEKSPQMPTGYPGMMILALIPPLWFLIMHRKIEEFTVELA